MNFVKYQGTTKPFKDFDEMCDWMKHTDGFPRSIIMSNGLRHMLECVGTAFIDVNQGTLVTSEQVYNMPPTYQIIHVMTIFQADDMSGLEYTFNVSLNINGLDKSELLKLSDSIVHLAGEPRRNPIYSSLICDVDLPDIGKTVDLFGYTWLVCHDTGNMKFLISHHVIKQVQWNLINHAYGGYAASHIKLECDQFAKDTGIDQLDYVVDTGVGKVFIPTKEQIDDTFSWFADKNNRAANDWYWLSTRYDSKRVWRMCYDGNTFGYVGASRVGGFRPCICIRYK